MKTRKAFIIAKEIYKFGMFSFCKGERWVLNIIPKRVMAVEAVS